MNRLLILTGVSGSGKSTVIKSLEDIDFYCIDNLPPKLIPTFIDLCSSSEKTFSDVAIVVDIRIPERNLLGNLDQVIDQIRGKAKKVEVVFLDSSDEVLIRRFKETRRRHPLAADGNIIEGIKKEREILANLKEISDLTVDTSEFNPHQLRDFIQGRFSSRKRKLILNFISFGFKHEYPLDADIIMDVRFIPNPNFIPELKNLDGNDKKVIDYVLTNKITREFIARFEELLNFLIPNYIKEGKTYLTVAVGCTGGRHRSVVIINELGNKFKKYNPITRHRDIFKY